MQTTLHKYGHVNTGWASRFQSERIFDPQEMVCPPWNNVDSFGRFASPNTFFTKAPGCNSASDRTNVENSIRPMNFSNVQLSNYGVIGRIGLGNIILQDTLGEDIQAYSSREMRDRQWIDTARRVRENKVLSGFSW